MDRCVNLRRNEAGQYEDAISYEPVSEERLLHFRRGQHTFCYDVVTLLKLVKQSRGQPLLPETRSPITEVELAMIRDKVEELFPPAYLVAIGEQVLPYPYNDAQQAIAYVVKQGRGSVFMVRQFNDPGLFAFFYPNGLDDMEQVFGLRRSSVPDWGDEQPLRDQVFERRPPSQFRRDRNDRRE